VIIRSLLVLRPGLPYRSTNRPAAPAGGPNAPVVPGAVGANEPAHRKRQREDNLGNSISLTASDGHKLGAYRADPSGKPQAGVVVIQEIFGVNHHIRAVCDRLAAAGYAAVAPALFDRFVRNFESGYSPDEVAKARSYLANIDWDAFLRDTRAAIDAVKSAGPVCIVGFCMGGSVAFLSAARIDGLAAASCFYGGQIIRFVDEKTKCPTQMHFGEKDDHIPMTDVATIRGKHPECDIHVYPAGHGFYCDERPSFHAPSAKLAWDRTLAWFERATRQAARV
jgi:carboxymethylenebutenolidase